MSRILIATDAWHPQVNGVVTTLTKLGEELTALGHEVLYITPDHFLTIPCPTYPSIRLAVFTRKKIAEIFNEFKVDAVHIATEGPIGQAVSSFCRRHKLLYTTSYHTQFPEYIRLRLPIPLRLTYAYLRYFHGLAARTMVATNSLREQLMRYGFKNIVLWTRGVDTRIFYPRPKNFLDAPRPISIYVGRVAVEKNIEDFLNLAIPGSKFIVGDGPDLLTLKNSYPDAHFVGYKKGEELARYIAAADVFVFPSRTDTFGLVLIEAMACGVPVAAYPVTGPIDIVQQGVAGYLDDNLQTAVLNALKLPGEPCIEAAQKYSWRRCAEMFIANLC